MNEPIQPTRPSRPKIRRARRRIHGVFAGMTALALSGAACGLVTGIDDLENVECIGDCGAADASPSNTNDGQTSTTDGSDPEPTGVPRLVAPLSTSTAPTLRPSFRWQLPVGVEGVRLEICRTRACDAVDRVGQFDLAGETGTVDADLPAGVVFFRAFSRNGSRVATTPSATWELIVRQGPGGSTFGSLPDFDGDGIAELAVGAPAENRVYVYKWAGGNAAAGKMIAGPQGGSFGGVVQSAGDVNGDGYADMMVGAFFAGTGGRVYIYHGGPNGISDSPDQTLAPPEADTRVFATGTYAGDVDGDGYGDIVVGANERSSAGVDSNTGRVYVFRGGPSGIDPAPATTIVGPSQDARIGFSVASGDFNGDGLSDIAYGTYASSIVYVHLGSPTGIAVAPTLERAGPDGGQFGFAISNAGDMNGDGLSDLLIAAVTANSTGRVYVYAGSATGDALSGGPIASRNGPNAGSIFGRGMVGGCDINGDSIDDAMMGTHVRDLLWSVHGSAMLPQALPIVTNLNGVSGTDFAFSVACLGDVNRDGFSEVCVGAPGAGGNGAVYCYTSSAAGVGGTPGVDGGVNPVPILTLDAPATGAFGKAIAGDTPTVY